MKKCVLGEFADLIPGVSYTPDGIASSGIRILRGGNINSSELQLKEDDVILSESYQCKDNEVHEGDTIVVASSGSADAFGKAATSWVDLPGVQIGAFLRIVRPRKREYAALVSAWVTQPIFQRYIGSVAKGTGINNIRKEYIEKYPINVDDSGLEQFSELYESICKKIALNRKRIATLEAMAKEIYDYWFVQFDFPDAHGRPYKSSGGAMVYNPDLKREIPKGWEVKPLGELTRIILGGTPATEEARYWEGGTVPWLSSGEVANFPVLSSEKKITELAIKNSATDLMPSGSVALSITRYIRPTILAIEACANQSVVGVLETEQLHNSLIYPYLVSQVPRFLGLRTGAQQPHINKDTVSGSMVPVATTSVLKWYYDLVDPVYNNIMVVARNLQEMYKLRDFLLPLLMNGQVKVA